LLLNFVFKVRFMFFTGAILTSTSFDRHSLLRSKILEISISFSLASPVLRTHSFRVSETTYDVLHIVQWYPLRCFNVEHFTTIDIFRRGGVNTILWFTFSSLRSESPRVDTYDQQKHFFSYRLFALQVHRILRRHCVLLEERLKGHIQDWRRLRSRILNGSCHTADSILWVQSMQVWLLIVKIGSSFFFSQVLALTWIINNFEQIFDEWCVSQSSCRKSITLRLCIQNIHHDIW